MGATASSYLWACLARRWCTETALSPPAISVLSALEGLDVIAPDLDRYVLPLALVILVILFVAQQRGTARIGRLLGPIMTIWFAVLALLGLWGIAQYPDP